MSGMKNIDDVDDDLFISKRPKNYIFDEKKANDIQEKTSSMLANTKSLLYESETIGQSTLEDLATQRDALERVENDLDNINSMTRATQKHLTNMRSFFGAIKSVFSSSSNSQPVAPIVPTTRGGMPKSATLADVPSNSSVRASGSPSSSAAAFGGASKTAGTSGAISNQIPRHMSLAEQQEHAPDEFEANLDEIGFGLGRLKEMARKLGDEIGDQTEMLDRITDKSERASDSIKHQNRQMQQILKKG